ncbi:hypothetical protein ACLOJK_007818 [Asimina triloba]
MRGIKQDGHAALGDAAMQDWTSTLDAVYADWGHAAHTGLDAGVYQTANVKLEWNCIKTNPDLSGSVQLKPEKPERDHNRSVGKLSMIFVYCDKLQYYDTSEN